LKECLLTDLELCSTPIGLQACRLGGSRQRPSFVCHNQ
jgi:hypothetical protein